MKTMLTEKRPLGKTDMLVTPLGLGCHEMRLVTPEEGARIVLAALDAGLNVIDTAECYGQSEEAIGRALRGKRRQECYIFTKCGHAAGLELPDWSPQLLEQSIERSLKRLQTDYLDLLQLHSCSRAILRQSEVVQVLMRAKEQGKVRYIGYSGDRKDALYAIKMGVFDVLQTSVNIADQESLDLLLVPARAQRMGVIAKHPIANAIWRYEQLPPDTHLQIYWRRLKRLDYDFLHGDLDEAVSIALRFTMSSPVDLAIIGTLNPGRFAQNMAYLQQGMLPVEQYEMIRHRWRVETWWRRIFPGGRRGWRGWN